MNSYTIIKMACLALLIIVSSSTVNGQLEKIEKDSTNDKVKSKNHSEYLGLAMIGGSVTIQSKPITFRIGDSLVLDIYSTIPLDMIFNNLATGSSLNDKIDNLGALLIEDKGMLRIESSRRWTGKISGWRPYLMTTNASFSMVSISRHVSVNVSERSKTINTFNLSVAAGLLIYSSNALGSKDSGHAIDVYGITRIGYSRLLHNNDHVAFELFQDPYGNPLKKNSILTNLKLAVKYKDFEINLGYNARFSLGKGVPDSSIVGLQPRFFYSINKAF